jgi:hypothetical protein
MRCLSPLAGTALALTFLAGCATYDSRFAFGPAPVSCEYAAGDKAPVQVLAAVIGVRYADRKAGWPAGVEVRLRVDNPGGVPVNLDPASMSLYTSDLMRLGSPIVERRGPATQPADGGEDVVVLFPFPPDHDADNTALDGLNLRWTLAVNGQAVTRNASFTRSWWPLYGVDYGYYGRYRFYYYGGYAGPVFISHHYAYGRPYYPPYDDPYLW